ncbi:N(6)-adenine-specific methyltransferase METTL4 isoform X2 [Brienomyrus brachyistius]|uniref:N(6)-adenine-specific methyltransferase METTL4 isoform X2 n=1 Tax=Brienomyrus brachyistius TaxID=42636 RepID=UPI0020B33CDF|nr:N(6)-adenine-specific methyltransferase METTL4 isoform X2 [Brienomyrus brachyistius]
MSIVFKNAKGWLVDQCSHIDDRFESGDENASKRRSFSWCFNRRYFDTLKPYIKPISADGLRAEGEDDPLPSTGCQKRKRKHTLLNQGEIDAQEYHDKVRSVILEGIQPFLEMGRTCGYLTEAATEGPPPCAHEDRLAGLCDMAKALPLVDDDENAPVQVIGDDLGSLDHPDLFTRVTENPSGHAREVRLMGELYLLPPRCRFLLSDISKMQPLLQCGRKFDAIVLDPPWENKSVKRSKRYGSLPSSQLRRIPISELSAPGCLVATWVTNRQRHRRCVREELYPLWGVEPEAEWLWVKVTRSGEYVFPLDSPHKKPYEVLVLGRRVGEAGGTLSSSQGSEPVLPNLKLLVSVPSTLHSHKPSLADVLGEFLRPDAECLELFARGLQPGWTSWGNEVLKFQHHSYFEREPPVSGPPSAAS